MSDESSKFDFLREKKRKAGRLRWAKPGGKRCNTQWIFLWSKRASLSSSPANSQTADCSFPMSISLLKTTCIGTSATQASLRSGSCRPRPSLHWPLAHSSGFRWRPRSCCSSLAFWLLSRGSFPSGCLESWVLQLQHPNGWHTSRALRYTGNTWSQTVKSGIQRWQSTPGWTVSVHSCSWQGEAILPFSE